MDVLIFARFWLLIGRRLLPRRLVGSLSKPRVFLVVSVFFILCVGPALHPAQASKLAAMFAGKSDDEPVKASLHADLAIDQSTKTLWIALRLQHASGWHTYWLNPGDSGLATSLEWNLPKGWSAPKVYWPMPERIPVGPLMNFGYEGDLWIPMGFDVPEATKQGVYPLHAKVRWLMCSDVCIPGEASIALDLRLPGPSLPQVRQALSRVPEKALAMTYEREGDRFLLRPVPGTDQALANLISASAASIKPSYFPEQAGWMINPAKQVLQVDKERGFRLILAADPSFKGELSINGYLQLGKSSYKVVTASATASVDDAAASSVKGSATSSVGTSAASTADASAKGGAEAAASAKAGTALAAPDQGVMLLMLMALFGGFLLNAMPCVFPVIGIKLLSLVPKPDLAATSSPELPVSIEQGLRKVEQGVRKASLLYGLGVLLSFWALGFVVVLLQAGGEQIGWGFQLQEPGFVFAMFILFLLIGANLLGLFEVGSGFMHWAGRAEFGALGSGMLAVLVATPCTAPMMGAALGASLSQGPAQAMAVFTALAVGMALPYGALALQPQWIHRLPKPGPWMLWTRKAMAFPMFFAAVWLAWVYVLQTDLESVLRLGFSAVCLLCACWLYGERVQSGWMRSQSRRFSAAFSLGLLVLSLGLPIAGLQHDERRDPDALKQSLEPQTASAWSTWSPEAVDRALNAGEIVFIDFTAAWCVSCQVNKQLVLSTDAVSQLFETHKVRSFRGDWTKQDPRITETLSQYGRRGVPLYLVLRRDRTPQVLPEVLTYGLVRDAVLTAAAP